MAHVKMASLWFKQRWVEGGGSYHLGHGSDRKLNPNEPSYVLWHHAQGTMMNVISDKKIRKEGLFIDGLPFRYCIWRIQY